MQVMTVSGFLAFVNDTFKAIWDVQEVAVEGEVSGYRLSQGQWVSFDLKDPDGLVNIFLPVWKQTVPIEDGMRVRVFGWPRIYPKYGKFSISAEKIELAGEGALRKALAALRQKFESEGLFDPARKRTLPRFPERIALVASKESAAYGDFIRVVGERWRGLEIDVYHVLVQGDRAPQEIVRAIEMINARVGAGSSRPSDGYDVLVMTRGGGSLDELMSFNDERVVRAVFGCKIPTMVAIGHERDVTFAEEVADVRGSTPTDCARRLVPDRTDVLYELAHLQEVISDTLQEQIDSTRRQADQVLVSADHWLQTVQNRFEALRVPVIAAVQHWFERLEERYIAVTRLFQSFDPRSVLRRGYAIVTASHGKIVTSVRQVVPGDRLALQLRDGSVESTAQSITPTLFPAYAQKENRT